MLFSTVFLQNLLFQYKIYGLEVSIQPLAVNYIFQLFFAKSGRTCRLSAPECVGNGIVDRLQIAVKSLAVDLFVADRRSYRYLSEVLSLGDIGNMDLHLGHRNACKRVSDGIAVMGVGTGV